MTAKPSAIRKQEELRRALGCDPSSLLGSLTLPPLPEPDTLAALIDRCNALGRR